MIEHDDDAYSYKDPDHVCYWCGYDLSDGYSPYCSDACAIAAERDSAEDDTPLEDAHEE